MINDDKTELQKRENKSKWMQRGKTQTKVKKHSKRSEEERKKDRKKRRRESSGILYPEFLVDQFWEISITHFTQKRTTSATQGHLNVTLQRSISTGWQLIQLFPHSVWRWIFPEFSVWLSVTCMQCVRKVTVSTLVWLFKWDGWAGLRSQKSRQKKKKKELQIPEFTTRCPGAIKGRGGGRGEG